MISSRAIILMSLFIVATRVATGQALPKCGASGCAHTVAYIGTHGSGPGQGIFAAAFDSLTGKFGDLQLAAEIEQPTWLALDPRRPILYSVSEIGNDGKSQGGVYSLAIDPAAGKLKITSQVASGGGGATHLAFDERLNTLFVANWGGGQVSAVPVRSDGSLAPVSSIQTDYGSGPSPVQFGPHAHSVAVDPSGNFVLSADLGADRIFVYHFDSANRTLSPARPAFESVAPGSGPRHIVFSPNGRLVYLLTELTAEIVVFRWEATMGRLKRHQSLAIDGPGYSGKKSAGEIGISRDGRFVYVTNRGQNTLVVYAVSRESGMLVKRQEIACGGDSPWSFAIDQSGGWMIVANENSSTLNVFKIDKASGKLAATGQVLSVPKPVTIAIYP